MSDLVALFLVVAGVALVYLLVNCFVEWQFDRGVRSQLIALREHRERLPEVPELAECIFLASRRDEGTISATGANYVAGAVLQLLREREPS